MSTDSRKRNLPRTHTSEQKSPRPSVGPRPRVREPRARRGVRHLFDAWPEVERRLRGAKGWLLLLDFDGTLSPITSNPESARLDRAMRRLLERLAGYPRARVYVISGRPLAYLERWVSMPGVNLMGLHGWEKPGVKPLRRNFVAGLR